MKKALLLLGLVGSSLAASAQWVSQPITFSPTTSFNLAISAVDANVVWTTVVDPGTTLPIGRQLARTTNGGTTWTVLTVSNVGAAEMITSLHALDANTAFVTVAPFLPTGAGRVLKTTDGGQTWTTATAAGQFGNGGSAPMYVRFFNANQGVVLGEQVNGAFEIYTTANGGSTWTAVPAASIPAAQSDEGLFGSGLPVISQLGNTLWVCTTQGRVFRSTDAGQTWTVASSPFTSSNDYPQGLSFRDANNGLLITDEGDLARTTDGGLTWTRVAYTGPLHALGLDAVPGSRTYVSTGISNIPFGTSAGSSYSTDDGQTWTPIESTIQHALVDFVSPTVGWSGGVHLDASGDPDGGLGMNKYNGVALATARPQQLAVRVAPNPSADGRFRLSVPAGPAATVRVHDAVGRLVLERQLGATPGDVSLDLSQYRAGVYTLDLRSAAGVAQQKLVIQ
jgi:photosystem II stability/assembly factor-like uncharacterized protein